MKFLSLQSFLVSLLISTTFVFLYLLHDLFKRRKSSDNVNNKGFKAYPILGSLPGLIQNRNRHLDWLTENINTTQNNTALFRRIGINTSVMIADPKNVEHVLKSDFQNHPKGHRFIAALADLFGRGLFVSNGDTWRFQRKALTRALNVDFLRGFVAERVVSVEVENLLVQALEKASESGVAIDLQRLFQRFAFRTACKMTFNGGDDAYDDEKFMMAFDEASEIIAGRLRSPFHFIWKFKKLINVGSERRLREAIKSFHGQTDSIILIAEKEHDHLLSRHINSGEDHTPENLRDLITGVILAGTDTTASALTWLFWNLSRNPEAEARIVREVSENREKNKKRIGDTFGFDELREMNYLHAAISESMRLYPPVPFNTRACVKDETLPDGTFVSKDWFVSYHPYTMARTESLWGEDCREFRPERWLDDGDGVFRQESPFKYPVFHAGPRMCLGKDMAYFQMKFVAATVIERFVISVVKGREDDKSPPRHSLGFTLRMEEGLNVAVKKRRQL